jgi:iron(III) transport system ATP-binding protein
VTAAPAISIRDVRRAYGAKVAVDGASLKLHPGRITCLLGPSGCGKSTLLRLVAGLEPVDAGEIHAGPQLMSAAHTHLPPEKRDIGLVFQDYALFPHLTVLDNVGFGLRKLSPSERKTRSLKQLERVRMDDRASAYPQTLSGGEQQRVALARALAREPRAILLDEPFSGLDGRLKAEVRDATLKALRAAGSAALLVTHDAEEAMMMGDELALMKAGRILQTGSPRACYLSPVSADAARLLGDANLLPATLNNGRCETPFGMVMAAGRNGPAQLLARPEALVIGDVGAEAQVIACAFMGATSSVQLFANGVTATGRVRSADAPEPGSVVRVSLDKTYCRVLPQEG